MFSEITAQLQNAKGKWIHVENRVYRNFIAPVDT
jgi:hypothetical protein